MISTFHVFISFAQKRKLCPDGAAEKGQKVSRKHKDSFSGDHKYPRHIS